MVRKEDLIQKIGELEGRLEQIYKYKPSLRNLDSNVKVMQSLNLKENEIEEVIRCGHTHIFNGIRNPLNGEDMGIFAEKVSIKKDGNSGEYGVFIGDKPYTEFFAQDLLTRTKLEMLSKEHPEIADLYRENQQLKATLSMLGK